MHTHKSLRSGDYPCESDAKQGDCSVNTDSETAIQFTHLVASEIHRMLGETGMSTADLAQKTKRSPAFIRRILQGENGNAKAVTGELIAEVVEATGRTMRLTIKPPKKVKTRNTVKSGDK